MKTRLTIAALAFCLSTVGAFAADLSAPAATKTAVTTTAAPASNTGAGLKKMHCPKGQHRISGKCVAKTS